MKKCNSLYYDDDLNLSNIPDYLIQPMVNKTLFSDVNVLDYVAPDEPIAMIVETIDYDSWIFSDSDKGKIQDALNSINNSYGLLLKKINKEGNSSYGLLLKKINKEGNSSYGLLLKKINKEGTSDGVKELKPMK